MTTEAGKEGNFHPEGLTPAQEKLADMLIATRMPAKVKRREDLPNGEHRFVDVTRDTSPFDFAQQGEFALKLHEKDPDAPLSPYYINLRNLPPEVYGQIGKVLAEIPSEEMPDCCTGIPAAGTLIAKAYSEVSIVPVIDIFAKEQTEEGRRIIGKAEAGEKKKILIVDDLVTQADTKFEAIKAAEEMGFEAKDVAVVIDREQGGIKQLADKEYRLRAAFTLSQLLDYYLRKGRVSKEKYEEAKAYLVASKQS